MFHVSFRQTGNTRKQQARRNSQINLPLSEHHQGIGKQHELSKQGSFQVTWIPEVKSFVQMTPQKQTSEIQHVYSRMRLAVFFVNIHAVLFITKLTVSLIYNV